MEHWLHILGFPRYSVSNRGEVRNDKSGHIMLPAINQLGIPHVGLSRDGVVYRRSIAPLVARAFLRPHHLPAFDTPINLNGDRTDNHAENLMWRPRWFSVEFHRQFRSAFIYYPEPMIDGDSGEIFANSRQIAMRFGLLESAILEAASKGRRVWPTHQSFVFMS